MSFAWVSESWSCFLWPGRWGWADGDAEESSLNLRSPEKSSAQVFQIGAGLGSVTRSLARNRGSSASESRQETSEA